MAYIAFIHMIMKGYRVLTKIACGPDFEKEWAIYAFSYTLVIASKPQNRNTRHNSYASYFYCNKYSILTYILSNSVKINYKFNRVHKLRNYVLPL